MCHCEKQFFYICFFLLQLDKLSQPQKHLNFLNPQKLINSETAIYDVLQEFFFHSNEAVRRAALEVQKIGLS